MKRTQVLILLLTTVVPGLFTTESQAAAFGFAPRELNFYLGGGANPSNRHGHSVFRSVQFELIGGSALIGRWLTHTDAGIAIKYSDVRQARSWFGYRDGDPDDSVRAESAFFFVRKHLRPLYVELGTGPMWSNRRIPAATSRFNFESQVGVGTTIGSDNRFPLNAAYRFSHISNAGVASRNPGLNVHSFMIGTRLFNVRPRGHEARLRSSAHP